MSNRKFSESTFKLSAIAGLAGIFLSACVAVEDDPLPVQPGVKRMFASSTTVTGSLGGLAGADAMCANWAQAADLGGAWKAFLSAPGTDAINRINEVGPWYNVNQQQKIFNNKTGFTVGALAAIRTEYGAAASGDAWTGTLASGLANGTNQCGAWAVGTSASYGSVGTPSSTVENGPTWMAKGGNIPTCNSPKRIYCFEQ